MRSEWFFYKTNTGWLCLECPTCYNNLVFEGECHQNHLLWKCVECGNYLTLSLKEIQTTAT